MSTTIVDVGGAVATLSAMQSANSPLPIPRRCRISMRSRSVWSISVWMSIVTDCGSNSTRPSGSIARPGESEIASPGASPTSKPWTTPEPPATFESHASCRK